MNGHTLNPRVYLSDKTHEIIIINDPDNDIGPPFDLAGTIIGTWFCVPYIISGHIHSLFRNTCYLFDINSNFIFGFKLFVPKLKPDILVVFAYCLLLCTTFLIFPFYISWKRRPVHIHPFIFLFILYKWILGLDISSGIAFLSRIFGTPFMTYSLLIHWRDPVWFSHSIFPATITGTQNTTTLFSVHQFKHFYIFMKDCDRQMIDCKAASRRGGGMISQKINTWRPSYRIHI